MWNWSRKMFKINFRDYSSIFLVSVLLVTCFFWAKSTFLDVVTTGEGRIVATGENKIIQSPQNAKITKFHFKENDAVTEGSVIITLSPIQAEASLKELNAKINNLTARKIRLFGELDGLLETEISQKLSQFPKQIIEAELNSVIARRADLNAQKGSLFEKIKLFEKEIDALYVQNLGKKELLEIINKEKQEIEDLLQIGAVGNSEKYRIDREARSLELELSNITQSVGIKQREIQGVDNDLLALNTAYNSDIIERISNIEAQSLELNAKKPAFVERVSNTQVISPINGKINKLLFNTLGAIVSEGEALAEIVPTDNELEIKGFIDPKDIGLVEPGQVARISLTAFDPSKYGFLTGVLKDISADAIFREETRSYMYEITTTVNSDSLTNELGQQIDILPGMIAQINIIRGQRSVLDYLWQPISKTKDHAFRE